MVQGMYANAQSRVRVGEGYSAEFEVKVGVHQGSVLSPLLFIIVLEALSREFRSPGRPLCRFARGMCQEALDLERSNGGERAESKCRKDEYRGTGLDLLQSSGEFHAPSVALEWAVTASSATVENTRATDMQWAILKTLFRFYS